MGHDWLFEVLADIKAYAEKHGMSALANQIAEAEATARKEVEAAPPSDENTDRNDKPARRG